MNFKLLSLVLLALINVIGIAMPFPILSPLVLRGEIPGIFSLSPMASVMVMLSLYPLGQFFGSPLIGAYSDKVGSRRVMTLSMLLTALGYLASAYALYERNTLLFCLTRFLTGFAEGNFSVLRAEMGRLAKTPEQKLRYFGFLNSSAGLGWLLGPLLGAVMSNKTLSSYFSYHTAFLFGSAFSFLGVLLAFCFISKKGLEDSNKKQPLLESLKEAWSLPSIRLLLFLSFCITLSIDGFYEFFPAFLVGRFKWDSTLIAQNNILNTGTMILSQLLLVPKLKATRAVLSFFGVVFALSLLTLSLSTSQILIGASFVTSGIAISVLATLVAVSISDQVPKSKQGAVMGSMDSLRNLGDALVCLSFGLLGTLSLYLPLMVITFVMLGATEKFGREVEKVT